MKMKAMAMLTTMALIQFGHEDENGLGCSGGVGLSVFLQVSPLLLRVFCLVLAFPAVGPSPSLSLCCGLC